MTKYKLESLTLGMVQTNCYIISNIDTKEALVIDPADNAQLLIKILQENDLVCKAILLTHGHFDHIMAAKELAMATSAKVYAHEAEADLLAEPRMNLSHNIILAPDEALKDGQELVLAGFKIKVIHTPGHTAGSVCYYFNEEGILFSGDTLFLEDIGRSDLPTGNGPQLVESIRKKLMPLKDETIVYPGHDAATTIGYERQHNIYVRGDLY